MDNTASSEDERVCPYCFRPYPCFKCSEDADRPPWYVHNGTMHFGYDIAVALDGKWHQIARCEGRSEARTIIGAIFRPVRVYRIRSAAYATLEDGDSRYQAIRAADLAASEAGIAKYRQWLDGLRPGDPVRKRSQYSALAYQGLTVHARNSEKIYIKDVRIPFGAKDGIETFTNGNGWQIVPPIEE